MTLSDVKYIPPSEVRGAKAIIDISHSNQSESLNARKIWEVLFRLVQGHKCEDLDSFLCDLRIFEDILKESDTIYWDYTPNGWTYTSIYNGGQDFKIQVIPYKEIIITVVKYPEWQSCLPLKTSTASTPLRQAVSDLLQAVCNLWKPLFQRCPAKKPERTPEDWPYNET